MIKTIALLLLPYLKPGIFKVIQFLVEYAEKKFNYAKAGADKKAFVLKKLDEYAAKHPQEVEKVKDYAEQELSKAVDNAVELAVRELNK